MEPPPVQYVRTEDGYDIAFTVCGEGLPFVFMPWPFSHRGLWWQTAFGRPVAEALAERFRLVQYDSRGQGMSTRGLPEYHSLADYEIDLEAVVAKLGLERFILYGGPTFCHVALRYACKNPDRVAALVLGEAALDYSQSFPYDDLARQDWDLFLHTVTSAFSLQGAPIEMPYWRDSITQDDYLRMQRATRRSNVRDLLESVRAPTLILNFRRLTRDAAVSPVAQQGQEMASLIPNAKLVLYDGFASVWYSSGQEPPAAVLAVEQFAKDLGLVPPPERRRQTETRAGDLSPREGEVLRLIAQGRSNQQIADELVLSVRTVERHITNLYAKIGAHGKADATAYALRSGLA